MLFTVSIIETSSLRHATTPAINPVFGTLLRLVPRVPVARNERRVAGAHQLAVQEEVSVIVHIQYQS